MHPGPAVCHKERIGQQGFCRMIFWFWAWVSKDGKQMWKRYHGKRLVQRWAPSVNDQQPLDSVPPHVGKAQTEQTHPFVTKSNATMYGARDAITMLACWSDALSTFVGRTARRS